MFTTNEYFDGNVMSIAFNNESRPATVGVMAPGDYVFNTDDKETMTVISGKLIIRLPGEDEFHGFTSGESFDVPASSRFEVKVEVETAYLCLYG